MRLAHALYRRARLGAVLAMIGISTASCAAPGRLYGPPPERVMTDGVELRASGLEGRSHLLPAVLRSLPVVSSEAELAAPEKPLDLTAQTGWLTTGDGRRLRTAHWPATLARPKGTVVMLHGRTEFNEIYEERARLWQARGFQVFSFDLTGQGLSDRLLDDPVKGHIDSFETYMGDIALFMNRIVEPDRAGFMLLEGYSLGGHLALRHLVETPDHGFDAAIMASPMFHTATPTEGALVRTAARLAVWSGLGRSYPPGQNGVNIAVKALRENDRAILDVMNARYRREAAHVLADQRLDLGGVTWGWLDAAFRSIDRVTADGYAARLDLPVLVLSSDQDDVVDPEGHDILCSHMPHCILMKVNEAGHGIWKEGGAVRATIWRVTDGFMHAVMNGKAPGIHAGARPPVRRKAAGPVI